MRPSKFRLPDSTLATTRSRASMASEIGCGSGPELPMQVVHPYPTVLKPSLSRWGVSPASARYSVTTFEPGASDVFTHGLLESPLSTAFLASSPAATITDGFEVLVQLVMAAMTTEPFFTSGAGGALGANPTSVPPLPTAFFLGFTSDGSASSNDCLVLNRLTRSCGRLGPATLGSTDARSRSTTLV